MNEINPITSYNIIPWPKSLVPGPDYFLIENQTIIEAEPKLKEIAIFLKDIILESTSMELMIHTDTRRIDRTNKIRLTLDPKLEHLGSEGYVLQVGKGHAAVQSSGKEGIFYGVQTLRQLLPVDLENKTKVKNVDWKIPGVIIEDTPRFSYRGFMLDEGRHFFGKEVVLRLLDVMALMKLNTFHWHLTEDQGWRIEIRKYPKLVEVGSKRKATHIGGIISKEINNTSHEGYYTQDQLKEIVEYAKKCFITIIPEIEMPGHCMASLASYPELSCTSDPFEVPIMFGIKKEVYCAGKDKVYEFLLDVLEEILLIFPSKIIHIGGDEVPKKNWKACLDCQQKIKDERLRDEDDLQVFFMNKIADHLASKERRIMGWNENLADNLRKDAIGQYWFRHKKKVTEHLRKGRNFVMSDNWFTYLDYPYKALPLSKCYYYDPIPKKLEETFHKNVLGIEAPMWTEWARNIRRLHAQTFPRLIAVAETGWTPKQKKDFSHFTTRLKVFLKRLDLLNIGYAPLEMTEVSILKRVIGKLSLLKEPPDYI